MAINGAVIVSLGTEQTALKEVKELTGSNGTLYEGCITFECEYKDLCILCYKGQSVNNVLLLLKKFKFKSIEDIGKELSQIDLSSWLDENKGFKVSCKVTLNDISSQEVNPEVGGFIIENVKKRSGYVQKVDLDNPDVVFFVYIFKDECYFGIDFAGFSLHKRSYKIFNHPRSLRGTLAYALVRIGDVKPDDIMMDPFCGSGEIPIEAGMFLSGFPVNYFNKEKFAFLKLNLGIDYDSFFREIDSKIESGRLNVYGYDSKWLYLSNSKKNAKIAGINKMIYLSRLDTEWIDTKFEKGSVDKIITQPPQISHNSNLKEIRKQYDELFYHAEFVLKMEGIIVCISRQTEELTGYASKYKFNVKEEKELHSGKEILNVIVFNKNKYK